MHEGVEYRRFAVIDHVDVEHHRVVRCDGDDDGLRRPDDGDRFGTRPRRDRGLTGPGWADKVFTFYERGAVPRHSNKALSPFEGGRVVVNVVEMPIKCPVAPLEFAFLADWYFTRTRVRDRVDITFVTPLDAAFTKPVAAKPLGGMLGRASESNSSPNSAPARLTVRVGRLVRTTNARSRSTWRS